MKKLIALLLVLLLTIPCCTVALAGTGPFSPKILNALTYSVSDWVSNDYMRSMATWVALLDYAIASGNSDTSGYDINTSYVGRFKESGLDVFIATEDGFANFVWYPTSGELYRYDFPYTEAQLQEKYPEYEKNTDSGLTSAYETLSSALEGA